MPLILLICLAGFAQAQSAKLTAPTKIPAGQIATITTERTRGASLELIVRPRVPAGGHVFDEKSGRIYFTASKPGRYLLILIAQGPDGFAVETVTIEVTDGTDPIQPDPFDDPFGLIAAATVAIKKHLGDEIDAKERSKRADWFASMADRIEADRLNSNQIVALTTAEIKTWPDPWRKMFNDLIEPIQTANLVTPARSAAAWRDIAKGMRP